MSPNNVMSIQSKKTLVIGATENPSRYANRVAYSLLRHGHEIELLGLRSGNIEGHPIHTGQPDLQDIDTVTMYVGARNQPPLYDYIKRLKPQRVIFNPGAENPEFEKELKERGIEPIEACTLVMLSVGTY
jgi:predicted CoA-binding protein